MSGETVNGAWRWRCAPADGGRLTHLSWRRHELLTPPPSAFRPPSRDYGAYETRPVFGYDDCLPTVDACGDLPDHGEVCWLPVKEEGLATVCTCRRRPLVFTRRLTAAGNTLTWMFTVVNTGPAPVAFLHVMHALMPLDRFAGLDLPPYATAEDEVTGAPVDDPLAALAPGTARMLLLRGVAAGEVAILRNDGIRLRVRFPADRFPTLGLWWNPGAYPNEDGCRRREFAVEPIPGPWSALDRSLAAGGGLTVPAGGRVGWSITWTLEDIERGQDRSHD